MAESILIVDDSSGIRTTIRKLLEAHTLLPVCGEAVDGIDAIEKAGELRPSIIILDLSMPRMNGLDAAHALRSLMSDVVIVLFTSFANMVSPSDAEAAGINAVISKDDVVGLIKYVQGLPAVTVPVVAQH